MDNIIGKIDRDFLVAAFVPSFAFVTLFLFVFGPIIPLKILKQLQNTIAPLDQPALLLLVPTVVISFSLYSLNTYIYKILEGYFVLERIPAFIDFQRRKVFKDYVEIKVLEKIVNKLTESEGESQQIEALKQQLYQRSAVYQLNYPLVQELIMPTRFGNALRAMEVYPLERYHMDAVLLWPRLIHVMPENYYAKLDQSNNSLAFLVNCSILSLGLAIASGFASGYQYLLLQLAQIGQTELLYFIPINASRDSIIKYEQNSYLYLIGIAIMTTLFVLFYRAAIPIATEYSNLVRSAFDLFRWDLFEALHLEYPEDYDDETRIWDNLSIFIGHGWLNDEMIPFQYGDNGNEWDDFTESEEE